MAFIDPQSTSFQRSEAWRLLVERQQILWSQQWVPYEQISPHLKRAVIASEDAGFAEHSGVEWDAIEQAWEKNQRAEARAEKAQARAPNRPVVGQGGGRLHHHPAAGEEPVPVGRAHGAAQGAGVRADADAGSACCPSSASWRST